MTLYVDTSVLVSALTNESGTAASQAWLAARGQEALAVSDWTIAEFSSALSIKVRAGHLAPSHRAAALAAFTRLIAASFETLAVARGQFRTAARFADQHGLGLRAGDSLHLAVCADHGAMLCTLDRRLGAAGPEVGVATLIL